jgi:hypothetical protein
MIIRMKCSAGGHWNRVPVNWSIENIEGKARLTETMNYKLNGFYKLVKPFIIRKAKVEKESVTHVGNIKRILESEAQS